MKDNIIVIAILVVLIGGAVWYIIKAKKSGARCIGCSAGGNCSCGSKESSGCGCGCGGEGESDCNCHADTEE